MRVAILKKKPAEKFAIGFKYSSADLANDATIVSSTATVTRSDGGTLITNDLAIVGSVAIDTYTVSAKIEKGLNSVEYYVTFTTTTSAGQIFQDKAFVKVRS